MGKSDDEDKKETHYVVIVGAAGTGKSTLVRRVIGKLPAPKGVVYFLCPSAAACFSTELAQAVGHYRAARWADACLRFVTGETKEQTPPPPAAAEPRATWNVLRLSLLQAAKRYLYTHGEPPTLVLDGMDLIARRDADFFLELQDFAKLCTDMGVLRLVFVFSDGRALPLLQLSSAMTRARTVYEVCDISDEEAVAWLQAQYQLADDRACEIVTSIAGGRFPLLRQCADSRGSPEEQRGVLDTRTAAELIRLGVSPSAPLFQALACDGRVKESAAAAMLEDAKLQELLRLNILSVHPDSTYSFGTRHVARFIAQAVKDADGTSRAE
jgi:energy-coupling factor transporter ATP-binding protein EcfA2